MATVRTASIDRSPSKVLVEHPPVRIPVLHACDYDFLFFGIIWIVRVQHLSSPPPMGSLKATFLESVIFIFVTLFVTGNSIFPTDRPT